MEQKVDTLPAVPWSHATAPAAFDPARPRTNRLTDHNIYV
jgi:hypothetical protein